MKFRPIFHALASAAVSLMLVQSAAANAATPFLEGTKVGESATHRCSIIPMGFDDEFEYFTLVVSSDTRITYGIKAKAKIGVVDVSKVVVSGRSPSVTATLLKMDYHKTKPIANVEVEITKVTE